MQKLSVIIVNYNVRFFLEQCLSSVERAIAACREQFQDYQIDIWVVDNNSRDTSLEMLRSRFPEVHLIANDHNPGFSFANNQAIKLSTAEYCLLLNPDTVIPEDTFLKIIPFMDSHAEAGALGVRMVDGHGHFLPESKRGLPTPLVSLYKMTGFSRLFPESRKFGQYHLGFLPEDQINEVDILAGAFMMLRKSTLDKIGLLDETFFMYGEDIDLSYRIQKGGYKNYYFPDITIIHYKGESTRKVSANYVFVFYRAMSIFAKKHFTSGSATVFQLVINAGIYFRAGIALMVRFMEILFIPVLDFSLLYFVMFLIVRYWERMIKYIHGGKYYAAELLNIEIPAYILLWMLATFLSGGYDSRSDSGKVIKGVFWGTILISTIYAFINKEYQYSRAFIVLGAIAAVLIFSTVRALMNLIRKSKSAAPDHRKILIVGDQKESGRVEELLNRIRLKFSLIGTVSPDKKDNFFIGSLPELPSLIKIYRADEVIFCSAVISNQQVISTLGLLHKSGVHFRILPQDSDFIIGSSDKNSSGDYYYLSEELLFDRPDQRLAKRVFDVLASVFLLLTFPATAWFFKNRAQLLTNITNVIKGQSSWIMPVDATSRALLHSKIRTGILSPVDELSEFDLTPQTIQRLEYLYLKDYSVYKDVNIFMRCFSRLGNKPS